MCIPSVVVIAATAVGLLEIETAVNLSHGTGRRGWIRRSNGIGGSLGHDGRLLYLWLFGSSSSSSRKDVSFSQPQ